MSRHPVDFAAEAARDFESLRTIAGPILCADFVLQEGEVTRIYDIAGALMRSAPSLAPDIRLLLSLGQAEAARAATAEALTILHVLDPYVFAPSPTPRLLAALKLVALPNTRADVQSVLHNCELDDVDIRRRQWSALCNQLVREGRGDEIPDEASAARLPPISPPGHDGIRSTRNKTPPFAMKPPQSA